MLYTNVIPNTRFKTKPVGKEAQSALSTYRGRELSRLVTAALINKGFCNLLLNDPHAALNSGFQGEPFRLEREEEDLVLSIKANSLADFAMQLVALTGDAIES